MRTQNVDLNVPYLHLSLDNSFKILASFIRKKLHESFKCHFEMRNKTYINDLE